MFHLARDGTAAAAGIVSGALSKSGMAAVSLGGMSFGVDTIAESAELAVAVGIQVLSPQTAPDMVQGLMDGSLALVARRVSAYAMTSLGIAKYVANPYAAGNWGHQVNAAERAQQLAAAGARYGNVHQAARGAAYNAFNLPIARIT